ncbi:MAG: homoserine kinase [bacterium]|nr:homoserine kinase [bacterium]
MSVYTTITPAEASAFLTRYSLPPLAALTAIRGGIENSNYFVLLDDGRELVLTLFEELSAAQAAFLGPLLAHLAGKGVRVAAPLQDVRGRWLGTLAGKPAQLAPRLAGTHPEQPDTAQCRAIGMALAQLHLALADYPLQRVNAHGAVWWNEVVSRWRGRLATEDAGLLEQTLRLHDEACQRHHDLPQGLIHGDLFRDNTLFKAGEVSAILDFSETGQDYWLLDMAITINDFCRAWPGDRPDPARCRAFIAGYEERRLLTDGEHGALPAFLATAAMRFWLSRLDVQLRNREEQRSGEHVLEKDPAEMRELTRYRLQAACA